MKKILSSSFVFTLFILGVFLLPSRKADAAITLSVSANPSSVTSGGYSWITWNSSGATACYRTDTGGSVALNSSTGFQVGPLSVTTTFTIRCTAPDPVPTTNACYIGYYENPDPVHPDGGKVTYTGADNVVYTESGIWNDMSAIITYKTGTSPSAVGAHTITCPTGSWSYPSACPTYCGYSGGTQTQTCTGGNSLCDGKAASRYCSATAACPTTGSCKGRIVAGSTECDGSGGSGPDEGVSCSYFTTKESCQPSSCSSWYHHGCSWSTVAI